MAHSIIFRSKERSIEGPLVCSGNLHAINPIIAWTENGNDKLAQGYEKLVAMTPGGNTQADRSLLMTSGGFANVSRIAPEVAVARHNDCVPACRTALRKAGRPIMLFNS